MSDVVADMDELNRTIKAGQIAEIPFKEMRLISANEKYIKTSGSIWRVKDFPRIKATVWECGKCKVHTMTETKLPFRLPPKPEECENMIMVASGTNKCGNTARLKDFTFLDQKFEDGLLLTVIESNKMPDANTRKNYVWLNKSELSLSEKIKGHDAVLHLISNFGIEVEFSGEQIIETDTNKQGKLIGVKRWVLGDHIKPKGHAEFEFLTETEHSALHEKLKVWDDVRFENTLPDIKGMTQIKRALMLLAHTPLYLRHNGNIFSYTEAGRMFISGDEGQSKSKITDSFFEKYLSGLGAFTTSAEYLTKVGLGGAVIKEGDEWVIEWGVFPMTHEKMICLDGFHSLNKERMAQMREMLEKGKITIVKVGKGQCDACPRFVAIANLNKSPLRKYYLTKYEASKDIGIGAEDSERDRLTGADRRRFDLFFVISREDENSAEVRHHILNRVKIWNSNESDAEDVATLVKNIAWTWSLRPNDYDYAAIETLQDKIESKLSEWSNKYPDVELSIFDKKAPYIFISYLIASASMRHKLKDGKVSPDMEDFDFVVGVFEDMFAGLELTAYVARVVSDQEIAQQIYFALTAEAKSVIKTIGGNNFRNMAEVAAKLNVSYTTPYQWLNKKTETVDSPYGERQKTVDFKILLQIDEGTVYYALIDGYLGKRMKIPGVIKGATLTDIGRLVFALIKEAEKPQKSTGGT